MSLINVTTTSKTTFKVSHTNSVACCKFKQKVALEEYYPKTRRNYVGPNIHININNKNKKQNSNATTKTKLRRADKIRDYRLIVRKKLRYINSQIKN